MRKRLLLTISLGAAMAIIAAGTATSVTTGEIQVAVPADGALPECSNLADDDLDGLVDRADPDCTGPLDTSEAPDPSTPPDTPPDTGQPATPPTQGAPTTPKPPKSTPQIKKKAPESAGLVG